MKGDQGVIDYLNRGLRSELTAVSQYWLHYRLQENWGLGRLAAKSRAESIDLCSRLWLGRGDREQQAHVVDHHISNLASTPLGIA